MTAKKRKPLGSAMEEFVFGSQEVASPPTAPEEVASLAPTPTASLKAETPPTTEAALPVLTPSQPEASASEPVPAPSKESSLTHRLQAPDKEPTVRFTVDMSVGRAPQAVDAGSQDGAQESRYCADVVGGWVEGSGGIKTIVLARIQVLKNFFQPSKSRSGLVT